jgi:hypothetical protein
MNIFMFICIYVYIFIHIYIYVGSLLAKEVVEAAMIELSEKLGRVTRGIPKLMQNDM